ncbi:MAG: DivIVA domain-containing protein [Deltaproteobacteria bacterium]|jgi:DivIVA domain-containing protein|nr:DivIVA domain-containing protein [Deltaproteobacteria bacterium]
MEKQEMKITPQDIIDKEFRVKFRGFDTSEVDSFLEEVAESFFRLTEENTVLNEKILALEQELEEAGSRMGQAELPAELENALDDLKQDMVAISTDLASLKQGRPAFDALENSLKSAVSSIEDAAGKMQPPGQLDIPADFVASFEKFKQGFKVVATELAGLKEDRQAFCALKNSLQEFINSARKVTSPQPAQGEIGADLNNTLQEFKQEAGTMSTELAALKQEIGKVQDLFTSHFKKLEARLSQVGAGTAAALPKKTEKLLTAEIVEEPEGKKEDSTVQAYHDYETFDDDGLEFINEDDILDVDKLRNVFQSVLDDDISDSHESREGDDVTAELLFLDDLIEDEPEPEVTFSLDEKENNKKLD